MRRYSLTAARTISLVPKGFDVLIKLASGPAWRTMEAARQVTVMMVLSVVMRVASTVADPVLHAQQVHPVTEVRIVCLRFVKVAFAERGLAMMALKMETKVTLIAEAAAWAAPSEMGVV